MAKEDWENEEEENEDENEEDVSSSDEKRRILKIMKKLDPTNPEQLKLYKELSGLIADMAEAEKNEKQTEQIDNAKWGWILPTVIQGVSAIANTTIAALASRRSVRDITKFEDEGNIVKTAATGFINKPR